MAEKHVTEISFARQPTKLTGMKKIIIIIVVSSPSPSPNATITRGIHNSRCYRNISLKGPNRQCTLADVAVFLFHPQCGSKNKINESSTS